MVKDFYSRKTAAIQQVENILRDLTARGQTADENILLLELNRTTGFSSLLKKHISALIASGRVTLTFDSAGARRLTWVP